MLTFGVGSIAFKLGLPPRWWGREERACYFWLALFFEKKFIFLLDIFIKMDYNTIAVREMAAEKGETTMANWYNGLKELPLNDWFMAEMGNDFWTKLDELVADIKEYGYSVLDANDEYITVENDTEDDADETLLYLGHANSTIWIERTRNI